MNEEKATSCIASMMACNMVALLAYLLFGRIGFGEVAAITCIAAGPILGIVGYYVFPTKHTGWIWVIKP